MVLLDIPSGIPFLDPTTDFIVLLVGFLVLFSLYKYKDENRKSNNLWENLGEVEKFFLIALVGLIIYFIFSDIFGGVFIGIQLIKYKLGSILYLAYGNQIWQFLFNIASSILSQPPNTILIYSIEIFLFVTFSSLIALLICRRALGRFYEDPIVDYFYSALFLILPFVVTYLISILITIISSPNYGIFFFISLLISNGHPILMIVLCILVIIFYIMSIIWPQTVVYLSSKYFNTKIQSALDKNTIYRNIRLSFIVNIFVIVVFLIYYPNVWSLSSQPIINTSFKTAGLTGLQGNISINSPTPLIHISPHSIFSMMIVQSVKFRNGLTYTIDIPNSTDSLGLIKKNGLLPYGTITYQNFTNITEYSFITNTTLLNSEANYHYLILSKNSSYNDGKATYDISSNSIILINQLFNMTTKSNNNCVINNCTVTFMIHNLSTVNKSSTELYYYIYLPKNTNISKMTYDGINCPWISDNYNCDKLSNASSFVSIAYLPERIGNTTQYSWNILSQTYNVNSIVINFTVIHTS